MERSQLPASKQVGEPHSMAFAKRATLDSTKQQHSLLEKCARSLNDYIVIQNMAIGGVDCATTEIPVSAIYCKSGTLGRSHIRSATLIAKYDRLRVKEHKT